MIDWFVTQFETNPVFSGLVGASGIGSALYLARSLPKQAFDLALRQFSVELTVHNDDDAFEWLNEWLARQPYAKRARRIRLSTFYGGDRTPSIEENGAHWTLAPGSGVHWFTFRGLPILIKRGSGDEPESGNQAGRKRRESFEIRFPGRSQELAHRLIAEAHTLQDEGDTTEVYRWDDYWRRVARKIPRELDTVVLPGAQKARIVADVERFYRSAAWYAERGVPYRRGYLFEGPPGTGKTSFVLALAGRFRRPLYVLNLGSLRTDDDFIDALSNAPAKAIVLIEDVDGARAARSRTKNKAPEPAGTPRRREKADKDDKEAEVRHLTMSAMLNAIDGAFATDGRVLFMTSNHPELLDAALLRPGRVDVREHFGLSTTREAHQMFKRFHPGHPAAFCLPTPLPAAQVQSILLANADDPAAAARALGNDHDARAA